MWVPKGVRPIAQTYQRYQWLYVYGFVHPASGRTEWLLLPTVSLTAMQLALQEFAALVEAGPDKQIVLLLDQAGWHASIHLPVPTGIHLAFLPPYTPELQPAERLWPLLNEAVANRAFASLDELEEQLWLRCRQLLDQPHPIRQLTCFHWWHYA